VGEGEPFRGEASASEALRWLVECAPDCYVAPATILGFVAVRELLAARWWIPLLRTLTRGPAHAPNAAGAANVLQSPIDSTSMNKGVPRTARVVSRGALEIQRSETCGLRSEVREQSLRTGSCLMMQVI
jgi:hypothetical protein